MKFHEHPRPVQGPSPEFSALEINTLKRQADKVYLRDHDLLLKSYIFLMDFEEGRLKWETMTDAQKRWLWAIKRQAQSLVAR